MSPSSRHAVPEARLRCQSSHMTSRLHLMAVKLRPTVLCKAAPFKQGNTAWPQTQPFSARAAALSWLTAAQPLVMRLQPV